MIMIYSTISRSQPDTGESCVKLLTVKGAVTGTLSRPVKLSV